MHVCVIIVHFYVLLVVFVFRIRVYDSLGLSLKDENENCNSYLPNHVSSLWCFMCCVKSESPQSCPPLWFHRLSRSGSSGMDSPRQACWRRSPFPPPAGAVGVMISVKSEDHVWLLCGCFHYTTCSVLFLHDLSLHFMYSVTLLLFYFGLGPAQNLTWKFSFCSKPSPIPSHS